MSDNQPPNKKIKIEKIEGERDIYDFTKFCYTSIDYDDMDNDSINDEIYCIFSNINLSPNEREINPHFIIESSNQQPNQLEDQQVDRLDEDCELLLNSISEQTTLERMKQDQFPVFDSRCSDAESWLNLFEIKMIEFNTQGQ